MTGEKIDGSFEQTSNKSETEHRIGAASLALANFQGSHKEIVDSSFNKALKNGEKLAGKNNDERRNYAYLTRLENLIEKHGSSLENKLWESSVSRMIIKPENITDGYWKSQEQILRDNGYGDRTLGQYEKSEIVKNIQEQQRESLESWSNYLGDENSPYPIWFKVYAWDGMTKMGVFDKEKGHFRKRDEHTVAPYPKLNPAALAKTYGAIADFYNFKNEERYEENSEKDEILKTLVKSGNFNKLYSKILLSEKAIPRTPERTEDVHGEWIEYLPGDEEKLADAAEGTPWCIADPGTGRNYLEYGSYAGNEEDDDDDYRTWSETHTTPSTNHAKFILFHLYDPEKNTLSESACASIRLDNDGNVAEISGLNEGQALEDSLVPIVEEKVKTLPGGEDFLEAFADKQELIKLDRKMQNGENLTKEELEFIYELERPIKTLDTYNNEDPRISELRKRYDCAYALEVGVDPNMLLTKLNRFDIDIAENLDKLINHGADANQLVSKLYSGEIVDHLDELIDHGADINQLVSKLQSFDIAENLDELIDHGADIDINQLVSELRSGEIAENLDKLIDHGADIDINQLVSKLNIYQIVRNLNKLIDHGADIDINQLVSKLDIYQIVRNLDKLIDHGADIDINQLVSELRSDRIVGNLDKLINHGADINQLVSKLRSDQIADNLDTLRAHGYQG